MWAPPLAALSAAGRPAHGAFRGGNLDGCSRFPRKIISAVPAARVAGRSSEHEPGGGLRRVREQIGQDTGARVGGQHDAAVSQLRLHSFEIDAGAAGETRSAVPQVVRPHGGSPDSPTRWWKRRVRKSGCSGAPSSATNTYPESCHAPPGVLPGPLPAAVLTQ
jgi:hypothetical protein